MAKVRPLRREDTVLSPGQQRQLLGLDVPVARGNLALLHALDADQFLEFRGQRYRVPPVSCLDGWAIRAELETFDRLAQDAEGLDGLLRVREAYTRLIARLVPLATPDPAPRRPGLWRRFLARIRKTPAPPHPFYDASVQEVAELVRFFSVRTRTSTVRSSSPTGTGAPAPSTSRGASANWH